MLAQIRSAFRDKQTTPGLLLCDGEERDEHTRLVEWRRRAADVEARASQMDFDSWTGSEDQEEVEKALWWLRSKALAGRSHQRYLVGRALQDRLSTNPGSPRLDAIVYELRINKKRPHYLRSIK